MSNSKERVLDPEQQAAYLADNNVVVSAGAGSGKTTVLAERYVRLATSRGLDLDSILTLTFTRKAAAEMYERIFSRLSASDHPRAALLLEAFDTARISTLDSFCTTIARGACHRYGIAPDFSMDDAGLERLADETAIELLMEKKEEAVLRRLVATRGFDSARLKFLVPLAGKALSIIEDSKFAEEAAAQIHYIQTRILKAVEELEHLKAEILALDELGVRGVTLSKIKQVLSSQPSLPETLDDASLQIIASQASFLASGRSFSRPRESSTQSTMNLLRELVLPLKGYSEELCALINTYYSREDIISLGSILDEFAYRFQEKKRREGLLSFNDVAVLAVDILKNDIQLRLHYKKHIRAIMIDEFQDDNELQKDLLYLLSEREDSSVDRIPRASELTKDKLFFVGDEKQSIYRFRDADVSVFRRLAKELTPDGSASLKLSTNYRSSPCLVSFFNAFFPGVFGEASEDYEAAFTTIQSSKPELEPLSTDASVEFHILEKNSSDEEAEDSLTSVASEAFAAALRIARGVIATEFNYGDVAILFRSTSHQDEYEKALRLLSIPFSASDPRGLFREGPVNDFYALLRLTLYPGDRNSYATYLRSPFVRLGDDALARIFLERQSPFFPEEPPSTWFFHTEDARRYALGHALYQELCTRVDRSSIASLIAYLWYDAGYRNALLRNTENASCLSHFDFIYDLALKADARRLSLSAFIDELAPLMGSSEKLQGGEASEENNVVRLLTIHKSKGLEFPVVVLADIGNKGRSNSNSEPYYIDSEFGLVVNLKNEHEARNKSVPNVFFERARLEEQKKEEAELRRLLYVAATRAEQKLFLFGSRYITKEEENILNGLETEDRLCSVLRTLRPSKEGQTLAKSFLDLIALGLSRAEAGDAQYRVFSIPYICLGERRRQAQDLLESSKLVKPLAGQLWESVLDGFFSKPFMPIHREYSRSTSPSALEKAHLDLSPSRDTELGPLFGASAMGRLASLPMDDLISKKSLEAEFGTLCHFRIERALSDLASRAGQDIPASLQDSFARAGLSEEEILELDATAKKLAGSFLDSPMGNRALLSIRKRSEFPFVLALEAKEGRPWLINGKMDLIFESENHCIIIDFKTDMLLDVDAHQVQMAAYRHSARAFSDLEVETWLFYLREGLPVQVTTQIESLELAELARGLV
ncbi:UvrD-helicase domain-containing protein [Treponema sp.]